MAITFLTVYAADPATPIKVKSTDPSDGEYVTHISTIKITFDITDVLALYPDVQENDFGLMNSGKTINIYKGKDSTGEIVGSTKISGVTNTSPNFVPGKLYTEITFENDVVLEANQAYCIVIPAKCYSVATVSKKYTNTVNTQPIQIVVYGANTTPTELLLLGCDPANESTLDILKTFVATFNKDVEVVSNAKASLLEGETVIATAPLEVSKEDPKKVVVQFNEIELYNTHIYSISISENLIYEKGNTSLGYKEIVTTLKGSSLKYFGYSLVSPSNNRRLSNIGRVAVTVDCNDTQYLGRDFKANAQLYKVGDDDSSLTPIGDPISCSVNESTKGFYIDVYNFNLEPSSKYQVIVAADQFHLWDMETQKPLHDTANKEMVFTYRTPDEIEPMPTQSFGAVIPAVTDPVENLTSFRLDFEQYVYENTFYYPVFTSFTGNYNVLNVVDKSTGENVADFKVDIKWDDMNNYWLENVDPIEVQMLKGHEYEITVPEGMFCCRLDPLKEVSHNKEYTVTYQGGYATTFTLAYAVEGQTTLTTEVARGSEVKVSFPENNGFKVASIAFNGESQTVAETFTTPAIAENSTLDIAYEYAGTIDYDFTTGVSSPEGCPFNVYSEGEQLTIEGIQTGDVIRIYTLGGLMMADLGAVPAGSTKVSFRLATGNVYIVMINDKTLKIQH